MQQTIKVNTVLFTKDGRNNGNAIVTNVYSKDDAPSIEAGLMFEITTDYGNKAHLTEPEILEMFYVANDGETSGERHKHFVKLPKLNTRLFTKDSAKANNGIVSQVSTYNFGVKTDNGGEVALSAAALNSLFDYVTDSEPKRAKVRTLSSANQDIAAPYKH